MTNPIFVSPYPAPNKSSTQSSFFGWLAILMLVLASVACYFAAPSLLRLMFPFASLAVGLFLYFKYPCLYLGFTWWQWFLIALIRRLIDYRVGLDQQKLILLSPFLVTLITAITFIQYLPRTLRTQGGLPFVVSIFTVLYGIAIGLVNYDKVIVLRTALDWLAPVLFGFHIVVNWRKYPEFRQNTEKVFLWCVLITGIYGIFQFIVAPEWDKLWLIGEKFTTAGSPEPFKLRIWGTMHSPGPFANALMAGLLLLLNQQHPLGIVSSSVGYLSFLLTVVRSSWGGWVVGLLTLLTNLKPKLQMRLFITIIVLMLCVVPLTMIEPFSKIISDRLETVTNLDQDQSYRDRSESYDRKLSLALSSPLGNGIGGTWIIDKDGKFVSIVLDSGILDTFFAIGWFGAVFYLGAIFIILYDIFTAPVIRSDTFASASRSVSLAIFSQMILGSAMLGLSGVILWGFLAHTVAAKKYYNQQRSGGAL